MTYTTSNPLNVLVLAGGVSSERDVSLASGQSVANALASGGHNVEMSDISPDDLSALDTPDIDVIFSVLHGTFGEDGTLQEIMEQRDLKFVGSGSVASRLAMDKWQSKQMFISDGITTTFGELLSAEEYLHGDMAKLADELVGNVGLPVVLKPVAEGSSVGVHIPRTRDELYHCLSGFFKEYGDCLAEKFNTGGEYTVGIVCGEVMPIIQIRSAQGFYDYEAKYQRNDTTYLFETDLDSDQQDKMTAAALRAYQLLGCKDLCRIDFMVEVGQEPQLMEVNTLPGFTSHSLVPKAAEKLGYSMIEICDKIVQNAFVRPI